MFVPRGGVEPGYDGDVELHEDGFWDVSLCDCVGGGVGGSVSVDGADCGGSGGGVGGGCGDNDSAGSIGGH